MNKPVLDQSSPCRNNSFECAHLDTDVCIKTKPCAHLDICQSIKIPSAMKKLVTDIIEHELQGNDISYHLQTLTDEQLYYYYCLKLSNQGINGS